MDDFIRPYLELTKKSLIISDAFMKANSVINNDKYSNILCSISGGADSDVMLDLIYKVDRDKKVKYVFFDTGLEYKTTKEHLSYLENRYGINIERKRASKPIPTVIRECGQPFLSKYVSDQLGRLQSIDFVFEDKPFEELLKKYPDSPRESIRWWCNQSLMANGKPGQFNVARNKYLKEFLIEYPPDFKISNKCCYYSKKLPSENYIKENNIQLTILGIRKGEGGIRASAYKNCYDKNEKGVDRYRPLFWFSSDDRYEYEKLFGIIHSKCYRVWGFTRTGCAGCPYSRHHNTDMEAIKQYEPNMYKACNNIFKDSYEYTKKYKQFIRDVDDSRCGRKRLF